MSIPRFLLAVLFYGALTAQAQNDPPGNSFKEIYKTYKPGICYRYDPITQTHDYSGNWDFDNDGIKDQLLFTGTGGAHLYFFLRMTLSSDKKQRAFRFLETDDPQLPPGSITENDLALFLKKYSFIVLSPDLSNGYRIYLHTDQQSFSASSIQRKQHGITSPYVILSFTQQHKAAYKNIKPPAAG